MCLLMVASPGAMPSRRSLLNAAAANPHGFGWAVVADGSLSTGKSLDADAAVDDFLHARARHLDTFALWHARYATHGAVTLDNCHPFTVGGDARTVLAHNGILPCTPDRGDLRSDSRILADDVLPELGGVAALDRVHVWRMLGDWAGGSKVAVLTVDAGAAFQCYILNEHLGAWDANGVWWSNDSHRAPWDDERWDLLCPVCLCDDDENDRGVCTQCGSCIDCGEPSMECLCYEPQHVGAW